MRINKNYLNPCIYTFKRKHKILTKASENRIIYKESQQYFTILSLHWKRFRDDVFMCYTAASINS